MPKQIGNKRKPKGNIKCSRCAKLYDNEILLQQHMRIVHEPETATEIKCAICKFTTETSVQFLLHMETHNSNKKHSSPIICRWFLQGRCSFGDRCWNKHSSSPSSNSPSSNRPSSNPPQCRFKSKCNAWPFCQYGHYDVCELFQECRNQSCRLEHPPRPFLDQAQTNLPPDLNSFSKFPHLPRRNWRTEIRMVIKRKIKDL